MARPNPVHAAPEPAQVPRASDAGEREPPGYAQAVEAALNEYDQHHYHEARAHFQRAHELFPCARTLRALGKVEFELRNYGEAVQHLENALASPVKPLTELLRQDTAALLERARTYVGEVHVDLQPESATVSVDGVVVARGPQASLRLLVGDHVLEFRATGRLPERRSVRIHSGKRTTLQVALVDPAPSAAAAGAAAEPRTILVTADASERTPLRRRWWVWTLAGATLVGVVTSVSVVLARDGDEQHRAPPVFSTAGDPDSTIQATWR